MTDIKELLERASDVPVAVDVESDLVRGRVAARRGRVRFASVVTGGVLVAAACVAGGHAVVAGDERRSDSTGVAGSSGSATPSPTPTSGPTSGPSGEVSTETPEPQQTITGAPVDPATLVHTRFFDVPPPPPGWYLVGGQASYVMMARDGSDADVRGGFRGRLMVLLGAPDPDLPGAGATAMSFDGRTFYRVEGGASTRLIQVRLDDGAWLTLQYPHDAGFSLPDMVAFLDAVQVEQGAMAVS